MSRRSVRHALRRAKSILEAMKPWLEGQTRRPSTGKSTIAEAIRYALRAGRVLPATRRRADRNRQQCRRARHAAHRARAQESTSSRLRRGRTTLGHPRLAHRTAKMNDLDPQACLADVLDKIAGRHPMSNIDELLPWADIKAAQSARWPENAAYDATAAD